EEHGDDRAHRERPFEPESDIEEHRRGGPGQGPETVTQQLVADGGPDDLDAPDLSSRQGPVDAVARPGDSCLLLRGSAMRMLEPQENVMNRSEFLNLHRAKAGSGELVAHGRVVDWRGSTRFDHDTAGKFDAHLETGIVGQPQCRKADDGRRDKT